MNEGTETILRVLTSDNATISGQTALDVKQAISFAGDVTTPLWNRLRKTENATSTNHSWDVQYLGAAASNAQSETTDVAEGTYDEPTRYSNTMQIMQKKVIVSETTQAMFKRRGMVHSEFDDAYQMKQKMNLLFKDIESALTSGTESTTSPRAMKGLTNWILAGNKLDGAAVQITADNIEDYVNDTLELVINQQAGARPNAIYCNSRFIRTLGKAAGGRVEVTASVSELASGLSKLAVGQVAGFFISDAGILELIYSPYLTIARDAGTAATSQVLFLYEDALAVDALRPLAVAPRAKSDQTETKVVTVEHTLVFDYPKSHAMLHNFYM